jgi:hypothetical protein
MAPPRHTEKFGGLCANIFLFLWIVPVLFVYVYHTMPTVVLLAILMLLVASLAPMHMENGPALSCSLSAGLILSTMVGLHCYYAHVRPLKRLIDGSTYSGVYAQSPALAYSDAAVLRFAGNATVDDTKSVGMTTLDGGIQRYCVAPVSDINSVGRVEFWAVGLNCCGVMGDFECDQSREPSAHDGVVVPDPITGDSAFYDGIGKFLAPPTARRDIFLDAIKLAEGTHGLVSSAQPVLVRWISQSRNDLISSAWVSILLNLMAALFAASLAAVFLTFAILYPESLHKIWATKLEPSLERAQEFLLGPSSQLPQPHAAPPVTVAAANAPRPAPRNFLKEQWEATVKGSREAWTLGLVIPFLVMLSSVVCWSCMQCFQWGELYEGLFVTILILVVVALLMGRHTFVYGILALVVALVGTYIGRQNYYANTFHYCAATGRRSYSNVLPGAPAAEYQDAGKLTFADGAKANGTQSVGYRFRGITYCAAPIVSEECAPPDPSVLQQAAPSCNGSSPVPVRSDFWAVGIGCCQARGGFECKGDADGEGSRTGVILRDSGEEGIEDDVRRSYLRAIKASSDLHNLPVSEEPALLMWGNDLDGLRTEWLNRTFFVIMVTLLLSFIFLGTLVGCFLAFTADDKRKPRRYHQ